MNIIIYIFYVKLEWLIVFYIKVTDTEGLQVEGKAVIRKN
jgi:hypothetical protein